MASSTVKSTRISALRSALVMSSSADAPKLLYPRKAEPVGWDFEHVAAREDPIPRTWWFVPWSNTRLHTADDTSPPSPHYPKHLLYCKVQRLDTEYKGSGIVIEETHGNILGCYKLRADTEQGSDIRTEVSRLKTRVRLDREGLFPLEIPEDEKKPKLRRADPLNRSAGLRPKASLRMTGKKGEGQPLEIPNTIRRLNGLLLDPRPMKIALHKTKVFCLHADMVGCDLSRYGRRYAELEHLTRNAMKDTFDKDTDLPLYRKREIKAAIKAGCPEDEFTEELESNGEGDSENKNKLEEIEVNGGGAVRVDSGTISPCRKRRKGGKPAARKRAKKSK